MRNKHEELSGNPFIQKSTNENYRPIFNKTNDSIEWAKWTWNPVTGCLFGCPYCYARKMAENPFYANTFPNQFKPTFHPGRLSAPDNHRIPAKRKNEPGINNVFLCSMADLFGDWIPDKWIQQVLAAVAAHPEYNFICLTKNPRRYLEIEFPQNIWLGCTADNQESFDAALAVFKKMDSGNIKFLSCEPLLERIDYTKKQIGVLDWVIIGGLKGSENTERQPEREWVENLIGFARKSKAKLYFKTNLTVKTSLGAIPKEFLE
jgi:protein gp37